MKLCVISFKSCWRESDGAWVSTGGFPLQIEAISSLFDQTTLLLGAGSKCPGGIPLPGCARVVTMKLPSGVDATRKLSVVLNLPYYLGIMFRYCREADVIHVPLPGDLPLLGLLVAIVLRKKLIVRYGGSWQPTPQATWMNRVTKFLMRRAAGGRRVMLATGEGKTAPAPGINWIFSSALTRDELTTITPDYSRGLQVPAKLVYVGRLSPEKGVQNLLQALALIQARGFARMPRLTIIGDGPQRRELEAAANQLECGDRVRFTGQLDRASLSAEFLNCDFAIQPSLTEGYCKAWLDAMAHGLPVLATSVGAAASVVGDEGERGWLVPPGNVARLAELLERILSEAQDWPALRRRCRQFAESRTLDVWAEHIGTICSAKWGSGFVDGRLR